MAMSSFFQSYRFMANAAFFILCALWLSATAFSATPNPQRVGEVRGETILYVAENEFAMIDAIKDGVATIYRYSADGKELGSFSISGKSVTGFALYAITSVGDYLIAWHGSQDRNRPVDTVSEYSVWSRTGSLIANVSLTGGSRYEYSQFTVEGNNLIVRRSNSEKEPLERFDLVTLQDGKSKALMTFPTRSDSFLFVGGIVSVLRDELISLGAVPFVHSYGLDGKLIASANLGKFIPNGTDGLGSRAVLVEPDPKAVGDLEVYVAWDFLRKVVSLDRATLILKSAIDTPIKNAQYFGTLFRRGAYLIQDYYSVGIMGSYGQAIFVNNQKIDVIGGLGERRLKPAPDLSALQALSRCVEQTVVENFRTICTKLSPPTIYRYDLQGDYAPSAIFTGEANAPRSTGYSAFSVSNSGSSVSSIRRGNTGEVEIPITFENMDDSAVVSASSNGYLGDKYVNFLDGRWRYDKARKALVAPALMDGTKETIFIRVMVGARNWNFDTFQVIYSALPASTTPLVEFFNTNLGHFFMTLEVGEAKTIDQGGAGPGWIRTGYSWNAWKDAASAPTNAKSVCRFYGNPALDRNGKRLGPNSHFYTIDPIECARVANDPGWVLESKTAFYALAPDPVNLSCNGSILVRRWYNNGYPTKDSNHRYGSSYDDSMQRSKWADEGVRFCLP